MDTVTIHEIQEILKEYSNDEIFAIKGLVTLKTVKKVTITTTVSPQDTKQRIDRRIPCKWSDDILILDTKTLNEVLKNSSYTDDEIADIKACKRRMLNRFYSNDSRARRLKKK